VNPPPDLPSDPDDDLDPDDDDLDPLPPPEYRPFWSDKLASAWPDIRWLWHGYLAPSNITLLTSQAKCGKSTLASVLMARRVAGGTCAGRALKPGRTAVVCEEDEPHWRERRRTLDFGDDVAFFCQPFGGRKPTQAQWQALLQSVAYLHAYNGVDLAIIDPLARMLPAACESSPDRMMEALFAFECLQRLGVAILLVHHPSKAASAEGLLARGHGALVGHVDINLEMHYYRAAADDDRRRVLKSFSRYPATPRQLVIELTPEGADYLSRGETRDEEFREHWLQLLPWFESAPGKLTRRQLRACLPMGKGAPSDMTLYRWLERAVAEGLLLRDGTGHCTSPFRYWLPAREEEWMKEPLYRLMQEDEAIRARLEQVLHQPLR
jgi:hypothetical protein